VWKISHKFSPPTRIQNDQHSWYNITREAQGFSEVCRGRRYAQFEWLQNDTTCRQHKMRPVHDNETGKISLTRSIQYKNFKYALNQRKMNIAKITVSIYGLLRQHWLKQTTQTTLHWQTSAVQFAKRFRLSSTYIRYSRIWTDSVTETVILDQFFSPLDMPVRMMDEVTITTKTRVSKELCMPVSRVTSCYQCLQSFVVSLDKVRSTNRMTIRRVWDSEQESRCQDQDTGFQQRDNKTKTRE